MKKVTLDPNRVKVPKGVDVTLLDYLQKGDGTRVAKAIGETPNYVSRVKKLRSYNIKILSALLAKGLENKKSLEQNS